MYLKRSKISCEIKNEMIGHKNIKTSLIALPRRLSANLFYFTVF